MAAQHLQPTDETALQKHGGFPHLALANLHMGHQSIDVPWKNTHEMTAGMWWDAIDFLKLEFSIIDALKCKLQIENREL